MAFTLRYEEIGKKGSLDRERPSDTRPSSSDSVDSVRVLRFITRLASSQSRVHERSSRTHSLEHQTIHLTHYNGGEVTLAAASADSRGDRFENEVAPLTVAIHRHRFLGVLQGRIAVLAEIRSHRYSSNSYAVIIRIRPDGRKLQTTSTYSSSSPASSRAKNSFSSSMTLLSNLLMT